MKYCPNCMRMLPQEDFYSYDYLSTSDLLTNYCKRCLIKIQREYDKEVRKDPIKKERLLARKRAWKDVNREKINAQERLSYAKRKLKEQA